MLKSLLAASFLFAGSSMAFADPPSPTCQGRGYFYSEQVYKGRSDNLSTKKDAGDPGTTTAVCYYYGGYTLDNSPKPGIQR